MPLAIKLKTNYIVESKVDLKQAIVNNLTVFFDSFPLKLSYELKMVSSITTQDGTLQTGQAQQVQVGTLPNGKPKYKTVVNKFIVLDIYAFFSETIKKKLTRLLIAPIDILDYNPTVAELQTLSEDIFNIIKGELRAFGVTAPTASEPSKYKGWWGVFGIKDIKYKVGPYKDYDTANQAMQTEINAKRKNWSRQIKDEILADEPSYPLLPEMVTWKQTIPGSMPDSAPPVSSGDDGQNKPGANATTLLEWYQAQGQVLPTVALRAVEYEELGLGPKNTYIATGEQNTALLEKLKAK